MTEKGWVRKLWPWLARHKKDVVLAFGVAIVGMVIAALTPVVEKVLFDNIHQHPKAAIWPWLRPSLGATPNGVPQAQDDVRSFRFAPARLFRGSWSATQSGASSVGPSKRVGGKAPPCLSLKPGVAPKRSPAI